ncbi:thiamine phosphate synthase [Vibrio mangrovi]|nr:thiamine phosphate synthase [Vibrio mangrovi]MDW6002444.1 thiamine phosphate synthase [Vibrio mangrovi]
MAIQFIEGQIIEGKRAVSICSEDKTVTLVTMESSRGCSISEHQNFQSHYHIHYCEQITGKEDFSQTERCDDVENIFIAYAPQPNRSISELWEVSDEIRTLSSAASISEQFPHQFIQRHLAWLSVLLILDFPCEDALIIARSLCNVSRETWPRNFHDFPEISSSTTDVIHQSYKFGAVDEADLSLYPVVDDVKWVDELLRLGVKTIQLRIKNPLQPDLEQQIKQAILLGKEHRAQVFINDYWKLAIQYQAFGVHLGQEDLCTANIQALSDAGIRLGISTHGYWEILKAQQLCPSYIALGHIFPTTTKQMPSKPQGLVRLKLYQQLVDSIANDRNRSIPTVAIGGINLHNAATVLEQGVSSLAVVRAITQAENTALAIDAFQQVIQFRRKHDAITQ